jgi:hypothetical protein
MQHTGKRRFDGRALGHAQFDVQRAGVRLAGTVRSRARQTVLPVTTGRQAVARRLRQQALIDARLLPVAGLEVRAEHAQIDQRKLPPTRFRQQRREAFAANARQRLADRRQDRRFHQRQRHRRGYVEDFPLVVRLSRL